MLWLVIYWFLRRLVGMLVRGSEGERELELAVLRYQGKLLARQEGRRLQFRTSDRAVLAAAALFLPRERRSCLLVGPETLRRWHRQFVRRRPPRPQGKPGRPPLGPEIAALVVRLGRENPLFRCRNNGFYAGWGVMPGRRSDVRVLLAQLVLGR